MATGNNAAASLEGEARRLALRSFCQRYGAIRTIAERCEAKIERLTAAGFSVFNYFWPDEMALSKIFADFLNPRGSHGQGALFLELFLTGLNKKLAAEKRPPLEVAALLETDVLTEAATSHIARTQRRIDILAVNPAWVLAVENKPWAAEQDEQLADYLEHLDAKYPDRGRLLIYLSGNYTAPTSQGRAEPLLMGYQRGLFADSGHFFLSDWLTEARDRCPVDKTRHFMADLAGWVERNFKSESSREEGLK